MLGWNEIGGMSPHTLSGSATSVFFAFEIDVLRSLASCRSASSQIVIKTPRRIIRRRLVMRPTSLNHAVGRRIMISMQETLASWHQLMVKCIIMFFGFHKYSSVTSMFLLLGLPTFDTVLHNARIRLVLTVCTFFTWLLSHMQVAILLACIVLFTVCVSVHVCVVCYGSLWFEIKK